MRAPALMGCFEASTRPARTLTRQRGEDESERNALAALVHAIEATCHASEACLVRRDKSYE